MHGQYDYIKSWNAPVTIADVPVRIIQRYTENINSAVRYIMNTVQKLQDGQVVSGSLSKDQKAELFGYKKTIIAASDAGKVFALRAVDGELAWSSDYLANIHKIFLRNVISREDDSVETEVAVIGDNKIVFMNANNGVYLREEPLNGISAAETKFMLVNLQDASQ